MSVDIIWEISILELNLGNNKQWKVTRRLPALTVAETKIFNSKKDATLQLKQWLQDTIDSHTQELN